MKMINTVLGIILFGLSAKASMTVDFDSHSANLINSNATSCSAIVNEPTTSGDISSRYFSLFNPVLIWDDKNSEAHIYNIQFNFENESGLPETIEITGDELLALFNQKRDSSIGAVVPPAGASPSVKKLQCPLIVGNIVLSEDVSFETEVVGTIQGYKMNIHSGVRSEFAKSFYFTLHNRGSN